jgi:putative SOS response-associated peptidase YedK
MLVILESSADALCLGPHCSHDALRSLMAPFAGERMEAYPVSSWVSNPKHDGPRWLEPAFSSVNAA